jgi:hypothetical protein
MATPQEMTALRAFRDAAAEVARVFDECSPWGGAAAHIARGTGEELERMTGEYTVEIPEGHRARFREAMEFRISIAVEEPEEWQDTSPEAEAFLQSLKNADESAPDGSWEIKVDTVKAQEVLCEVLRECVVREMHTINHEKKVDRQRRKEFDEEVEAVDFWFALLGRIEPWESEPKEAVR